MVFQYIYGMRRGEVFVQHRRTCAGWSPRHCEACTALAQIQRDADADAERTLPILTTAILATPGLSGAPAMELLRQIGELDD